MRMPRGAVRSWLGYLLAVVAPVLVSLLDLLPTTPSTAVGGWLLMLAVALVAVVGGVGPALLATALSFLSLDFFFAVPRRTLSVHDSDEGAALLLFLAVALLLTLLLEWRNRLVVRAELEAERRARLQIVSARLAEALTPQDVLEAVVTYGVTAADAVAGSIATLDEGGERIRVVAAHGYTDEELARWGEFTLDADLPLAEVVRTGKPVFVATTSERDEHWRSLRGSSQRSSHAIAALPLLVEGRTIGALGLTYGHELDFDAARRGQKMALARLAAQALERARHYEAEQALRERLEFLSEASRTLASSLDYEQTLGRVAALAVPRLAEWCTIDVVSQAGELERLAVAHEDPAKVRWAKELEARYPPDQEAAYGAPKVARTGVSEFVPEISDDLLVAATGGDRDLLEILRGLGLRSSIAVPLQARGRVLGALTLLTGHAQRRYTELDLRLAEDLGRRAGVAIDNARLFREAEHRGDAARALAYVNDGVLLLDADGTVRYLNAAAEAALGVDASVLGRPAREALPDWNTVEARAGDDATAIELPVSVNGEERWLALSAVTFAEGAVYALRDVGDERRLERERSEFVATASHELRTPVAAIFGAARTLRRHDVELAERDRAALMRIIEEEADRLAAIVDQVLLAGTLERGELRVDAAACDVAAVARSVVESASLRGTDGVRVRASAAETVPATCDAGRLRQVLVNLVDNAVKYSPGGGEVEVHVRREDGHARIEVADEGLGIPRGSEARIFEKFVRLDPAQTGGVGGTGLGLYISRELVERMHGRIWVEPNGDRGSRFLVELPLSR